jgi:shikimate kinase
MKFVLIFGPHAVGKMKVGQELAKITDLKLFHNHMTIELVTPIFDFGTKEGQRLVNLFRQESFEAVAKSDLDGLIFT